MATLQQRITAAFQAVGAQMKSLSASLADKVAFKSMNSGSPWETVDYDTLNKVFETKFVNGPASTNGPDPAYSLHYYLGLGGGDNPSRGAQFVMTDKDGGTAHIRAKSGTAWGSWNQLASLSYTTSALALKLDKVSMEGLFNPLDFGDGRYQMTQALGVRDLTACFNTAFNTGLSRWRIPGGDYPIRNFTVTGQVNAAVYVKKNISIYIEGEPGCRIIAGAGLPEVSSGLFWFQTDTIAPSSVLSPPNSLAAGGRHTNKVIIKGLTFDGTELSAQNGRSTGTGLTFLKIYNYVNPEVCHCNFIGGFSTVIDGFNPLGLGNIDQGLSTHSCMNGWAHHNYFEGIYDVACYPNGTILDAITGTDIVSTTNGSNVVTVTTPTAHGLNTGDSIHWDTAPRDFSGIALNDVPYVVTRTGTNTFTFIGRNVSNVVANATATATGGGAVKIINVTGSEALENSDNGNGFLLEHNRFYRVGAPCQFKRGMQRVLARFNIVDTAVSGLRAGSASGSLYGGRQVLHDNYIRNILGTGLLMHGPDCEAYNNIVENFGKLPGGRMFTSWQGVPNWTPGSVYYNYVAGSFPTQMASVVSYNGRKYYCTTAHTATSTFDSAKFVALDTLAAWAPNTAYTVGTMLITSSGADPGNYVLRVLVSHTSSASFRNDNAAGKIIYMSTHIRNEDSPMGAIVGFATPKCQIRKNTVTQKGVWAYPASYWPASPLRAFTLSGSNENTYGSIGCDVVANTITGVPVPFWETESNTDLGDPAYGVACDYNTFRDNTITGARSTSGVVDNRIVGANSKVGSTMVFTDGLGFNYRSPGESITPVMTLGATSSSGPYTNGRLYVQGTVWGFQSWFVDSWVGVFQFNPSFIRLQQSILPAGTALELGSTASYFNMIHSKNVKTGAGMNVMTSASASPATGTDTWSKGDYCRNSSPAVGQPKGWYCTASGTPGVWVSEGNL